MAVAVDTAVRAARAGAAAEFEPAVAELRRLDREQLRMLLGALARDLVEQAHPDGLDSDDAEAVLQSCIRAVAGWYRPLDTDALIRALTGALGVAESDDHPATDDTVVITHGVLLIADLLHTSGRELPPLLDTALAELQRSQTVELP